MRHALPALASMIGLSLLTATPSSLAKQPSPPPVPGGLIGVLPIGKYTCELPGDAGGPVRVNASEFDFKVVRGSSYRAGGRRGSYLLTGDLVQMTGGTLKGLRLHRVSDGFLRRIDADGQDGEMRCVLGTAGNS